METAARLAPDVIISDIAMPELDGLSAMRQVLERDPQAKVILLSVHGEPSWVRDAFAAGATGYLVKTSAADELETALREVLAGRRYVSPAVSAALLPGAELEARCSRDP